MIAGCAGTGPWSSGYDKPAKRAPSVLTETQLRTDLEVAGTTYDPYGYYDVTPVDGSLEEGEQRQAEIYADTMGQHPVYEQQAVIETPETVPALPQKQVKVAILLPLSGTNKAIGKEMLNAAQLALFDIGNKSFELLPKDTKGTKEGAVNAATQALQSGADIILGPVFSDNVKAIRPLVQSYGVHNIAFSTDWTAAGGNTLIMGILPFSQVERITNYMVSQGHDNFALLAEQSEYGEIVRASYNKALRRNGKRLVSELMFNPLESDLSLTLREFTNYDARNAAYEEEMEQVETILEQQPYNREAKQRYNELKLVNTVGDLPFETLMIPVGGKDASTIVNLLRYYDIDNANSRLIGTGLWDDPGILSEEAFDGALFASPSPLARSAFEKNYERVYGKRPIRISSLAYDATALTAVLAHQAYLNGYVEPQVFSRSALFNPNGFAGVDGIFRFHSNGLVERGLAVLEIQNGTLVVQDPAPVTFQ